MNKKSHTYTIMVVPEHKGDLAIPIRLSRRVLAFLSSIVLLIIISGGVLLYAAAREVARNNNYHSLRSENETLKNENMHLRLLCREIDRMDTLASYLEMISNISSFKDPVGTIKTARPSAAPQGVVATGGISSTDRPDILPVDGWVTQKYSQDTSSGINRHTGIDIAAAAGSAIRAPMAGTMVAVVYDTLFGTQCVVEHDLGYCTRYCHCDRVLVHKGEAVERGQLIALVGNSGKSTAPHLHYEVTQNGKNVNPLELLSRRKNQ